MAYDHKKIEADWQRKWKEEKTFHVKNDPAKPKYYALDMFPYPSGAGLHVGHPLGYIASDIVARFKRHAGFNVLHPMGYDSFGLPAEQYAIQTGQHPAKTTEENAARYREQLDHIGFSFDWSREVRTSDPKFYKWTQWIFLQLFNSFYDARTNKARPISELIERFEKSGCQGQDAEVLTGDVEEIIGPFTAEEWKSFSERTRQMVLQYFRLAYLSEAWVNWCPALGTVLANDEVKDGVSERGGHPVERKRMHQWSLRITAYAQRLLDGLDELDWSGSLKEAQRNWIGRSTGASVRFAVDDDFIEVFTTRPDTLFGVSFITLAPEHVLVGKYTTDAQRAEVEAYVKSATNRSERERQAEVDKISGVFTGRYAKHPFTGAEIPIWVGDYVLAGYGTGAVMAVPGGDQRDWRFARHFDLPIIPVTEGADMAKGADERKDAVICSEGFLKGLKVPDAISRAIEELEKLGAGEGRINYRLRDAAFGRQRYWGEPIPIYYKDDIPYPLPESALPLELPVVDKFQPTETGEPPLARAKQWAWDETKKKIVATGEGAPLETTTMPGWAGSSWYYLRYMDPHNEERFASPEAINYWQQIDLYIGGSEHSTGHLLYFRFWTKFLYDLGLIPFDEPAKKLVNQGMIQGMSAKARVILGFDWPGRETEDSEPLKLNDRKKRVLVSSSKAELIENDSGIPELSQHWNAYDGRTSKTYFEWGSVYVPVQYVNGRDELDVAELSKHGGFEEFEFLTETDGGFKVLRDVEKMSKRWLNVVNPDEIIERYGADTLRLYEMFLGPLEQSKPWDTHGIEGTSRFLRKFWNLFFESDILSVSDVAPSAAELKTLHATLKKVTEDIERMSFNTSVAQFMIAVNELSALKCNKRDILEPLTIALSPFAPHIAEELWKQLGHSESISKARWPQWHARFLEENNFTYPISFNGKTRLQLEFPANLTKDDLEAAVLANPEVQQRLEGKTPKKVIVVPKRIVNIVL
ncbi:MAG: class I tRNA ligase family protein [Flavobacteriales bacterium]|nr:leucine--tRNA ligase [Flavobacteriales bacterium]